MSKKMFLVDGSNQAFRAFFAIQSDMRAPDGFHTGLVWFHQYAAAVDSRT